MAAQPDADGEGKECCCPLLYPMWVMPLRALLALTELPTHLDLKAAGQVLEFAVGTMVAIFVSHQWVAFDHPDPEMRQFSVLQDALRNIVSGRVRVRGTVTHRFVGKSALQLLEEQIEELRAAYVWYDWFSCPQLSARSASQQVTPELQAAVDSIPAYVTLCSYFVVLVPSIQHHELPETECDRASWSTRAWCRLEHFAWFLADGKPPSMVIRSAEMIHFTTALQWLDNMPGSGVLTVEADRPRIRQVVEAMAARKLHQLRRSGDLHGWRFMKALHGRLMSGLARPAEHLCPDKFLSDFEFSDALASGRHGEGAGWTPLHYAAVVGEKVLGALVLSRCDPNARTRSSYPFGFLLAGSTPVLVAAALGSHASVRALLQLRADPSIADTSGFTALMFAARRRDIETEEVLEDLVAARADLHAATAWPSSMTALHLAAMISTPKSVSALIGLRADVAATSFVGNALTAASMYNGPDVVELLLRSRMDPNLRWETWGSCRWVLGLAARAANLAGSSPLMEMVSISDGSTPLIFAARSGNMKAVRALLAAKADSRARASNGGTAAAEARARGLTDILLLLQEAAGSQPALKARVAGRWGLCAGVCESAEGGMVSILVERSGAEWDEVVERPQAAKSKKASL